MKIINKKKFEVYSIKNKKFNNKKQKISIITVVYNGGNTLEKTIKNILKQTYNNFEFIIVYTPSDDKTFEIIKKYKSYINKIIVNYDVGIYQSMNLGSYFASGDYINFMNSGDYFYNRNIIKKLFIKKKKYDVIFGDCEIYYEKFKRLIVAKPLNDLSKGMCFSHQSCFVKTLVQRKYHFNKEYFYSADFEFFCKIYKKKKKFTYCNQIISRCMSNGIVDRKKHITLLQNLKIRKKYFRTKLNSFKIFFFYIYIFYQFILYFLKLVVPKFLLNYLLKIKYSK